MPPTPLPRIAVLMATFNGRRWLPEQLQSILDQEAVDVRVFALDDGSTDGTAEWLAEQAATEPRLHILESGTPSGSSAANFYRMIARTPVDGVDLIAFADQDDVWMPGKLARHAALIADHGYDGVSGNVTSFTPDGKRTLVRKSYPQRRYDFLCESPGPGSTFLMTPRLFALAREVLATQESAHQVDYHDSLVYSIARSRGWAWHIDDVSTVDYRQHEANVMGSNVGGSSALARVRLVRQKWHRGQAIAMATTGLAVVPDESRARLEGMLRLVSSTRFTDRLALARLAGQLRRRPRDQRVIRLFILSGAW